MNPMMSKFLGPPPGAVMDGGAVSSIMQERHPMAGEVAGLGVGMPAPQMAPAQEMPMGGPAPSWRDANPFKDDMGNQRGPDYDTEAYSTDGLGNGGADMQQGQPDDLRDALLAKAAQNNQVNVMYQDGVVQKNDQDMMQGKLLTQPAPGY